MLTRILGSVLLLLLGLAPAWAGSVTSTGSCPGVTVTQGDTNIGCRSDNVNPAHTINDFANKYNAHWHEYDAATLTNNSGGGLVAGDVVRFSASTDNAVVLGDTVTSRRSFVVAMATIADAATGEFARGGVIPVKCTGTITRGDYVRKSATTKVVETTSVAQGTDTAIPDGALGLALTSCSGGFVTAYWFARPATVDALVAGANITITPGTRQFTIAAPTGLQPRAPMSYTSVSIQIAGVGPNYVGFFTSTTEADVAIPLPFNTTVRNMYALQTIAPGGSETYTYTFRSNNADTAVTCTITGAARQCADTTHTATVTAGHLTSIKVTQSGPAADSAVFIIVEVDPS